MYVILLYTKNIITLLSICIYYNIKLKRSKDKQNIKRYFVKMNAKNYQT